MNEDLINAYDSAAILNEIADLVGIPMLGVWIIEAELLAPGERSYKYKDARHTVVVSISSSKGTSKLRVLQKGCCTGRKTQYVQYI